MQIDKIEIIPPDNISKLELTEKIIALCERKGCEVVINPHIKPKKEKVVDEIKQVEQILGINPTDI